MIENLFIDLSLVIILAMVICGFMRLIKQPLIIGYIITGIIASFLGLFPAGVTMEAFSRIGIALLLFVVGLGLNPKVIRELGKPSLIIGIGQFTITTIAGYLICVYLGFSTVISIYIALALCFSSGDNA